VTQAIVVLMLLSYFIEFLMLLLLCYYLMLLSFLCYWKKQNAADFTTNWNKQT